MIITVLVVLGIRGANPVAYWVILPARGVGMGQVIVGGPRASNYLCLVLGNGKISAAQVGGIYTVKIRVGSGK